MMVQTRSYEQVLADAIHDKIADLRADGVTSVGDQSLMRLVRPPMGGPVGVNCQWMYQTQIWPKALAMLSNSDRAFVYRQQP